MNDYYKKREKYLRTNYWTYYYNGRKKGYMIGPDEKSAKELALMRSIRFSMPQIRDIMRRIKVKPVRNPGPEFLEMGFFDNCPPSYRYK